MIKHLPKPLLFAVIASMGALLAAIVGEIFLSLYSPKDGLGVKTNVVLLIDTSSSMSGSKLSEVKSAVTDFINNRNLSINSDERLAIAEFGRQIRGVTSLTHDTNLLTQAVTSLRTGNGTPMAEGLEKSMEILNTDNNIRDEKLTSHILLFTDGYPADKNRALVVSELVKHANIQLVVVATGDADKQFLSKMTGDITKVFTTRLGEFKQAFKEAEKKIFGTAIELGGSNTSLLISILTVAVWTAILAVGISLFLIMGQNSYLHRPLMSGKEFMIGTGMSIFVGFFSGIIGQLLYSELLMNFISTKQFDADSSVLILVELLIRTLAWVVLGILLSLGMSLFIPNLKRLRASFGGFLGGLLGVMGFLLLTYLLGDTSGRILGCTILGFFIGLMIALVELSKEAWLEIQWGQKDKSILVLGETPIIIGSSQTSHIYLPEKTGAPGEVGVITWRKGVVEFHNKLNNQKQILRDGSKWKVGEIEIEVKINN